MALEAFVIRWSGLDAPGCEPLLRDCRDITRVVTNERSVNTRPHTQIQSHLKNNSAKMGWDRAIRLGGCPVRETNVAIIEDIWVGDIVQNVLIRGKDRSNNSGRELQA